MTDDDQRREDEQFGLFMEKFFPAQSRQVGMPLPPSPMPVRPDPAPPAAGPSRTDMHQGARSPAPDADDNLVVAHIGHFFGSRSVG